MAQITKTTNREVPLDKVRNIGIIAHIDAGKTTTTERILFYTGKTYKLGDIDEGTTVTDWMPQERERGITIVSAAITTFWRGCRINIIDTPGHVDFTAEVERSLRVLDGAVMIFDAASGVQSQSETVWHQADKYHVPRLIFMNKMDVLGADFKGSLKMIKDRLSISPVVLTYPIGSEQSFKGVIALLENKALYWNEDPLGIKWEEKEVPAEMQKEVAQARHESIEQICAEDETLLEKYLNGEEPTLEQLKAVLRKATISLKLVPLYVGSSLRNKGVQPVLDGVVDFLPSPMDIPPVTGFNPQSGEEEKREAKNEAPLSALAFKIQVDPHVGKLTYLRIYSGTLKAGCPALNSVKRDKERIGRLLLMHADKREEIVEAYAGEIVAAIGLTRTSTGDTICDPGSPIVLESIKFPEPVISLAIEPKTKSDQEKLGNALNRLSEEDPTFKIKVNHETGQTIIAGMGELHLEIIVDRMRREFGIEANTGAPQIAYKETITKIGEGEGKYIHQSGGRGQYGHCWLRVEPKNRGEGYEFKSEIKGGAIPNEFIAPIEKGVKEAMENGVLAGFPIVDMKVVVYDGSFHEVDSSEIAFKIAGSQALQTATRNAGLTLLEPIMKVEVTTPEEFMGTVIGDLSARRAQISGTEIRGPSRIILGFVPLAEISGYSTTLRSLTQGRASYYMEPSHYQEVPKNIIEAIVAKRI
ncbi:elongation factor G [Candidatus Shapirobacteria bacterium CG03_land_8_20_14_0_80_39_12]|uniref:Elongation factor G n=1 Tax=Candidatus Shapirobacteria bacterium CG03_land_8_20_14_0_80_39_12 TaxID=1974879 RepID=A0A2M7BFL6_9BACT|nr:MAG: elongation factor G [Candidatus Shapirobacteria bacterium CG03_land_8_20_14_0_80_39_12]